MEDDKEEEDRRRIRNAHGLSCTKVNRCSGPGRARCEWREGGWWGSSPVAVQSLSTIVGVVPCARQLQPLREAERRGRGFTLELELERQLQK